MEKIASDPEGEEVKGAERHLWEKIYKKSGQGRRTGVGITAEGDMIAAMGLRYGTEEATAFSEASGSVTSHFMNARVAAMSSSDASELTAQ
mgnify:CR=1 FL=1